MTATSVELAAGVREGALRPLDRHFADWMGRLASSGDRRLLLAAALVSRQVGDGHVCLDLAAYADRPLFHSARDGGRLVFAPSLADWRQGLESAAVVGRPGDPAPLILDGRDRLYLGRYWRFERDLAEALRARCGQWIPDLCKERLRAGLDRLFPPRPEVDWQRVAAAMAVLLPFCVISGGPGTGKTRTVTAILALLLEQAEGKLRIAMAAPTGKAAARLVESAGRAREQIDLDPKIASALPTEASTLHRLLGLRPGRARPRHGPDNPLHLDVLVVDEASMVDLPLMARLMDALREGTRLILLGDKDQLASVEAGMVLGDICGRGGETRYSARLCAELKDLAGTDLQPVQVPAIADHLAVLRKSFRFGGRPGIGAAARAVNGGDGEKACEILTGGDYPDAILHQVAVKELPVLLDGWLVPRMRECLQAGGPEAVLKTFNRFRILCAVREGPFGLRSLNRLCEEVLERAGLIARGGREQYPGRPVLVTSNDYALGLYNGDVGILLKDDSGRIRAWFDTAAGLRRVLLPRMPTHATVFAMTVHKSQGSEFDEVLLVLPEGDSRVMTRELLYTGITRAKEQVQMVGSREAIVRGAARRVERSSGLYEALWGGTSVNRGAAVVDRIGDEISGM
jgi:exodeoxyribonuclease V alpha subunit